MLHGAVTFALLFGGGALLYEGDLLLGGYLIALFGAMLINGVSQLGSAS